MRSLLRLARSQIQDGDCPGALQTVMECVRLLGAPLAAFPALSVALNHCQVNQPCSMNDLDGNARGLSESQGGDVDMAAVDEGGGGRKATLETLSLALAQISICAGMVRPCSERTPIVPHLHSIIHRLLLSSTMTWSPSNLVLLERGCDWPNPELKKTTRCPVFLQGSCHRRLWPPATVRLTSPLQEPRHSLLPCSQFLRACHNDRSDPYSLSEPQILG